MAASIKNWKREKEAETGFIVVNELEMGLNLFRIQDEDHKKVTSVADTFLSFKHDWPEQLMKWVKGYKAIVFDEKSRHLSSVYFEPKSSLNEKQVAQVFQAIRNRFEHASSVKIARNHAGTYMEPNELEIELARVFNKLGEENGIEVKAHYSVSPMGMFKFKQVESHSEKEEQHLVKA